MASPDIPMAEDPASPEDAEYSNGEEANQDDANMSASDAFKDRQTAVEPSEHPHRAESNASASEEQTPNKTSAGAAGKANSKDPLRPRRKKARRACFACQRAHLTCGDERPCQRCIKRGLQDACHDGVRKKAKYLHDAPAEALIPPGMGGYHHLNGIKANSESQKAGMPMTSGSLAQASTYYAQAQPSGLELYSPGGQHPMQPPLQNSNSNTPFNSSQPPISPHFAQTGNQPTPPLGSVPQSSQPMQQFGGALFDPSDPALFNLDIASLNFGNHYGALEFGMLDQMSSAANAFSHEGSDLQNVNQVPSNFGPQYPLGNAMFVQDALRNADWASDNPRINSPSGHLQTPHNTPIVTSLDRHDVHGLPQGYAIGAGGPGSLASASPASQPHEPPIPLDNPSSPALFLNQSQEPSPTFARPALPQTSQAQPVQPPDAPSKPSTNGTQGRKRPFDADYIYDHPPPAYSYRNGFHSLLHLIHKRFSKEKRMKIAKALAAVRPSLITFSQSISNKDRAFGEQALQRKLYEYRDFIAAYGTPSIICRRDGNVVAASKEFHILTGWSKDVLLCKVPNLNVNTGAPPPQPGSADRTRLPSAEVDKNELGAGNNGTTNGSHDPANSGANGGNSNANSKVEVPPSPATPGPVFIAELMCQDSVVQFYEDYAKLAFGDASGHACRRVNLLKYRTKEDDASINNRHSEGALAENTNGRGREGSHGLDNHSRKGSVETRLGNSSVIHHEADINRLGEKEGMVSCMMIWSVRRDVFEVPMLIVMNFLPILS